MTSILKKSIIMKNKILPAVILIILFSTKSFSQTTTPNYTKSDTPSALHRSDLNKKKIYRATDTAKQSQYSNAVSATTYSVAKKSQVKTPVNHAKKSPKKPMYRDTRLGSSSKKYNTYKKNDKGAGAITTNPNK